MHAEAKYLSLVGHKHCPNVWRVVYPQIFLKRTRVRYFRGTRQRRTATSNQPQSCRQGVRVCLTPFFYPLLTFIRTNPSPRRLWTGAISRLFISRSTASPSYHSHVDNHCDHVVPCNYDSNYSPKSLCRSQLSASHLGIYTTCCYAGS